MLKVVAMVQVITIVITIVTERRRRRTRVVQGLVLEVSTRKVYPEGDWLIEHSIQVELSARPSKKLFQTVIPLRKYLVRFPSTAKRSCPLKPIQGSKS